MKPAPVIDAPALCRRIVEHIPVGLTVVVKEHAGDNGSFRFILVNPAQHEVARAEVSDWVGKTLRERFPGLVDSQLTDSYNRALATQKTERVAELRYGGDERIPEAVFDVLAVPMDEKTLVVVSQNVSERAVTAAKLGALLYELERSNVELGEYVHAASHDIREPARLILSYCQLLNESYRDSLDARGREWLTFASEGAARLNRLIDDLLRYSTFTRDQKASEVQLDDALDAALADLALSLQSSGAQVTRSPLPIVQADPTQMSQVFQNLISNAIKYSQGSPVIEVRAVRERADWKISVADHGIGIPPDYHQEIFEMFRRLHPRDAYPGTGIGLAICRRIIERHHGQIWVESNPAGGSTFCFTLPAQDTGNRG